MRIAALFLGLYLAAAASAQTSAPVMRDDPRVFSVSPLPGQPLSLNVTPGSSLALLMAPGERVSSVTVGDPSLFSMAVSQEADCIFINANRPSARTTVSLRTELRSYDINLTSEAGRTRYYLVRLSAAGDAPSALPVEPSQAARPPVVRGQYKLSGNRELLPSDIYDDGQRTYIQWPADLALPAVFALDRLGREEMVNAYMRESWFTIDRVHERLVFRLDKTKAEALRTKGAAK